MQRIVIQTRPETREAAQWSGRVEDLDASMRVWAGWPVASLRPGPEGLTLFVKLDGYQVRLDPGQWLVRKPDGTVFKRTDAEVRQCYVLPFGYPEAQTAEVEPRAEPGDLV